MTQSGDFTSMRFSFAFAGILRWVQQRGEFVSREQIVEKVWGKGVYFDTDNSINGAIRKIRQVLKDDPVHPRFIQTIAGKGYRV